MTIESSPPVKEVLEAQRAHWDANFSRKPDMFGGDASAPALEASKLFRRESKTNLLELGGGQGRDTLYFGREGFQVTVVDYSQAGVEAITAKAEAAGLRERITPVRHDVREPLPFESGIFDCCYSHMLFCMALTTPQLERLSDETCRVLKPGGLHVYTVRHTGGRSLRKGNPPGRGHVRGGWLRCPLLQRGESPAAYQRMRDLEH